MAWQLVQFVNYTGGVSFAPADIGLSSTILQNTQWIGWFILGNYTGGPSPESDSPYMLAQFSSTRTTLTPIPGSPIWRLNPTGSDPLNPNSYFNFETSLGGIDLSGTPVGNPSTLGPPTVPITGAVTLFVWSPAGLPNNRADTNVIFGAFQYISDDDTGGGGGTGGGGTGGIGTGPISGPGGPGGPGGSGGGNCGCGGGVTGLTGGAATSDCYSRTPSAVWEASVNSVDPSNDGNCSQMLRLKDSQDLTNVDPTTGEVVSPWYAKCILSALAPCSEPNFIAFGGFWNWMFQNKHPDLLFVMRVGIMFFDSTYTFNSEVVWNFQDPSNGTNAWQQLPGGSLVTPVPGNASFFRYQIVAMVAVASHGGIPATVNTGTGNNYASFLFDSLYAVQQSSGSLAGPLAGSGGLGSGDCTGNSQGGGGSEGGGSGGSAGSGSGTGSSPGGGGNISGTATVTSTHGTLSYKTTASSTGTDPHTVQLDWDAALNIPDPVTSFNIYRGNSVGSEVLLASTANGTTHTYTDTTAVATETYYYYVTAVNVDGESTHLSDVSIQVPLPGGFVEWDWHGVTVFWSDGSISAPPDGSITQSGLPDGLLFYYFPYYDFASNTVKWVTGGSGDDPAIAFVASTQAEIASQSLVGRISLFPNLSAGTSGGPPGGGF